MTMLPKTLLAIAATAVTAAPAIAASDRFGMSYHVERADSVKLSVGECLATAQSAAARIGYAEAMRQLHPGQLGVFAAGPRGGGGGSLTVYCIAVDRKTAFVVQALDYNRANSPAAQRAADAVRQALLRAAAR